MILGLSVRDYLHAEVFSRDFTVLWIPSAFFTYPYVIYRWVELTTRFYHMLLHQVDDPQPIPSENASTTLASWGPQEGPARTLQFSD